MDFANNMAPGVSERILRAEHESDLKNSKWRILYGGQVNLDPDSCSAR